MDRFGKKMMAALKLKSGVVIIYRNKNRTDSPSLKSIFVPVFFWISLTFSPPRPMTTPTRSVGIRTTMLAGCDVRCDLENESNRWNKSEQLDLRPSL